MSLPFQDPTGFPVTTSHIALREIITVQEDTSGVYHTLGVESVREFGFTHVPGL